MNNRTAIKDELNELNSLLPLEKGPEVYSVPAGYFEGFAESVVQRLKIDSLSSSEELEEIAPFLASLPKEMPFSVPDGYFSETTEGLSDWVKEESLPQFLQSGKQMPFSVPDGYFESLPGIILKKVSPREAKVIPISSSRKWMRYAVAAMVAGIIAVSSVLYFGNNNQAIDPASESYEWVATNLKNVPNKELDEFINTTYISSSALANTNASDKTEVRKLLKDISDSEINKFLEEIPIGNEDLSAL